MIQSLQSQFTDELKLKQDSLDKAQAALRGQTRTLADARKAQTAEKERKAELDQVQARIRNLEHALRAEDGFDWAGRAVAAFGGADADAMDVDADDAAGAEDPDLPPADDCSAEALLRLRRMRAWHARIEGLVGGRIGGLKNAGVEKEYMYRKVIAICTGIPFEVIEQVRPSRCALVGALADRRDAATGADDCCARERRQLRLCARVWVYA